jgi:hypothetical protein
LFLLFQEFLQGRLGMTPVCRPITFSASLPDFLPVRQAHLLEERRRAFGRSDQPLLIEQQRSIALYSEPYL